MKTYLNLLKEVLETGEARKDRTGTGTLSLFGAQTRYNLADGFPLVTTKKCHLRSIIHELLWFLKGDTNLGYLHEKKVTIWDEWADEKGDLGPIYGHQWRKWEGKNGQPIDQIAALIERIRNEPQSRRHIVNAWNVADLDSIPTAPPPCHTMFQFYVHGNGQLSCQLYQRSADLFLGVPFNIASYALLTMMIAQVTDLKPGYFVHTFGDVHLYTNHVKQAKEQLSREPRELPIMKLNPHIRSIFEFSFDDFTLENYDPHPAIKAPIAV